MLENAVLSPLYSELLKKDKEKMQILMSWREDAYL